MGAGPGDPELITLKAYRLLQEAELVIYAGSLVNPQVLQHCAAGTKLINSSHLNLDELVDLMVDAYTHGKKVVRLHTGDPSLYGAIGEQMDLLAQKGIPYSIVPGVSSFLAAAASLQREFTVPGGTQTLIITRLGGRTPVPAAESLSRLAMHQASMAIFLSVNMIEDVAAELLTEYPTDTPVAVVEKASWEEERVLQGRLQDLVTMTRAANITKTALVLVGHFLRDSGQSKLYDKEFSHAYRSGQD